MMHIKYSIPVFNGPGTQVLNKHKNNKFLIIAA